jgi:DNA-binding NarL/FixJ family response regulator
MSTRTPIFVYADDPVSQAGLEQLLRTRSDVYVVACGQIDDARVAVVGCEEIDDATIRTIMGIQRDGCPHVIVVATRLDEEGVLAAGEAGTLGMLRRHEATPERLAAVVAHVVAGETSVPADLVGRLLGAVRRLRRAGPFDAVPAVPALDERERSILELLAEGRDTAEIALTLCYSERTVKGVIHGLTTRLQLRNRSHAVAFALRNELI